MLDILSITKRYQFENGPTVTAFHYYDLTLSTLLLSLRIVF